MVYLLLERATKLLEVKALAQAQQADQEWLQQTFRAAAENHIANHLLSWSNDKHIQQWSNTLKTYVYPTLAEVIHD